MSNVLVRFAVDEHPATPVTITRSKRPMTLEEFRVAQVCAPELLSVTVETPEEFRDRRHVVQCARCMKYDSRQNIEGRGHACAYGRRGNTRPAFTDGVDAYFSERAAH